MSFIKNTLHVGRPSVRNNKSVMLSNLSDEVVTKRVNFDLSSEQHMKLKIYAAKQGKTVKEVLTEYVEQLPE